MVTGIESFKEWFKGNESQYAIIGGTACDILTRNTENSIQRIDKKAALPMLCQQSYRPCSPIGAQKMLALVDRLGSSVPLYRLGCNMEPEAAQVAYHGMNHE